MNRGNRAFHHEVMITTAIIRLLRELLCIHQGRVGGPTGIFSWLKKRQAKKIFLDSLGFVSAELSQCMSLHICKNVTMS